MRGRALLLLVAAMTPVACQAAPADPAPPPATSSPPPAIVRSDGSSCPDHPTPACTGVLRGTELTKVALNTENVAFRVRTPGTVLDGVHVPGHLLIHADDVTVRNSVIDGDVINADGPQSFRFTITDSTVGTTGKCEPLPRHRPRQVQGHQGAGAGAQRRLPRLRRRCGDPRLLRQALLAAG
ncbi:hypothetical protein GCM10020220_079940 [Nonomuraea rubra]|uniref:hypothetical protein n=1 Tax=Nonomuraea rubra TaxID=46180 RepID=UPI0031EACDED